MVNVLIDQFAPEGAVIDAAALAQFQQHWTTYRKLIDHDYLSHREVSRILHETLAEVFTSPFRFLDIACGDASMIGATLRGTAVRHYQGIDLSEAALELAAANLAEAPYEVELDHRDFVDALLHGKITADAAWCSLSVHHLATDDKRRLMSAVRSAVGPRGLFLLYEPTSLANENRPAYLDRFEQINRPLWKVLTPAEWDQIWNHVTTCDFPETAEMWCRLGREAGFATALEVFTDPTSLYCMYRYAG